MLDRAPKIKDVIVYRKCDGDYQKYIVLGEWSCGILAICKPEDFEKDMLEKDVYGRDGFRKHEYQYKVSLYNNKPDISGKITQIIWENNPRLTFGEN